MVELLLLSEERADGDARIQYFKGSHRHQFVLLLVLLPLYERGHQLPLVITSSSSSWLRNPRRRFTYKFMPKYRDSINSDCTNPKMKISTRKVRVQSVYYQGVLAYKSLMRLLLNKLLGVGSLTQR